MSSNATLVALEGLVLRLGLLSPKCFESLIGNLNYGDSDCLKMLISKGLGLAIIAGATCVKLPQIFKITKSGSATGISFVATLLELLAVTANGAYSFSKGFPFSSYGEAVTLSLQTSLIALLILWYGGNSLMTVIFSVIYGATVFAITTPGLVPEQVLWLGQAANIPMVVLGKMIQVIANFRQGHTGQLSAITLFMLTLGSMARVFTSIQETGDMIVISTYLVSSTINLMLSAQVMYYWNANVHVKQE